MTNWSIFVSYSNVHFLSGKFSKETNLKFVEYKNFQGAGTNCKIPSEHYFVLTRLYGVILKSKIKRQNRTLFKEWVPLRDNALRSRHDLIPMILLLMTTGLFSKANFSNVLSLSSPLCHTEQRENDGDAGQLVVRHAKHKHLVEFCIDNMFL